MSFHTLTYTSSFSQYTFNHTLSYHILIQTHYITIHTNTYYHSISHSTYSNHTHIPSHSFHSTFTHSIHIHSISSPYTLIISPFTTYTHSTINTYSLSYHTYTLYSYTIITNITHYYIHIHTLFNTHKLHTLYTLYHSISFHHNQYIHFINISISHHQSLSSANNKHFTTPPVYSYHHILLPRSFPLSVSPLLWPFQHIDHWSSHPWLSISSTLYYLTLILPFHTITLISYSYSFI